MITLFPLFPVLGLLAGFLLAKIAPEEIAPGRKYILLSRFLFLFLTIIPFTFERHFAFWTTGALLLGILVYQIWKSNIFVLLLPIIIFIPVSFIMQADFLLLLTTAIFLYSIPVGLTFYHETKKS